jgi:hypothetical protein
MFEALSAWREVVHLSEWTGLSIGALAGLALLAFYLPTLRRGAVKAAAVVVLLLAALTYGNHTGRADLQKQWDAARARAELAQQLRDHDAAAALEAKYQPVIAGLQAQADDNASQVKAYERKIVALIAGQKAGSCALGADALRLRQ